MIIQFKRGEEITEANEFKFIEELKDNGFEVECSITAIFVTASFDDLIQIHQIFEEIND